MGRIEGSLNFWALVAYIWSFHVPHMMSSLMYSWNCAGHFATSWHLSWSWIRTFSWLMDMLVWHILLWWSVKWHCAGASTCCTLFNLFQHQNLGIRCTWTRSWRAPWKFRWASRCEFLHETSTAPVYPCQDTSALQEVLKKALEKATWSWRESPNIPPKVVVNDDVFFGLHSISYVNSQDFTFLLRYHDLSMEFPSYDSGTAGFKTHWWF